MFNIIDVYWVVSGSSVLVLFGFTSFEFVIFDERVWLCGLIKHVNGLFWSSFVFLLVWEYVLMNSF